MLDEPRAGRLAAWGNALFAGLVSPDDAMVGAVGTDTVHRVVGLPDEPGAVGLTLAFGRMRALGVRGLRIALPAPGHPLGLSGPAAFNSAAIEAGEAVLASGCPLGLVPEVDEVGPAGDVLTDVVWRCLPVRPAAPADVPSLGEAERELAEVLREATEALTRLDVAGAGPMAMTRLEAYRARMERGRQLLAPGYPPRAVRVLELAGRVGALVDIADEAAGEGHGAAVSAAQIAERDRVLRAVERAARRARVAAYNAYAEELERQRG
ncbi:hypothetical protein [Streptomyces radicis]|uniref:Serine/threonine protein kinase n=1 Tax=Streptomyces radicis TaxID=1750517 RepID=A0A3A9VTS3_9ACTN|nr:hypothetical protein [Streptomyces radicis]RKN03932.1 hypothetical protein D7319_30270 [Streptomyces radicis]RKN14128.1 hypothetical protein D7318_29815 [Streptomyces radicis]